MNQPQMPPSGSPHEQPDAEIGLGSTGVLALLFGLTLLVIILLFATWFWAETQTVALWVLFAGLILTGVLGAYARKVSHAAVALVVSFTCLAPALAWELPQTRVTMVRALAAVVPPNTLRAAMGEEEAEIGTSACRALIGRGYDEVRNQVRDFAASPDATVACLNSEIDGTDAEKLLRRDVVESWEQVLLQGRGTDPCSYLGPWMQLSPRVYDDTTARLLNFAHSSDSSAVRGCARDEFDASFGSAVKQLRGLGDPREVSYRVQKPLFSSLVAGTYAATIEGQKAANTPALEQWTLSLGCSVLSNTEQPATTIRYLNTAMMAQNCGALTDQDRSVATWSQTCIDSVDEKTGFVTTADLCSTIRKYARSNAIEYAQTLVRGGIDIMQWRALNGAVRDGHLRQQALLEDNRLTPFDAMENSLKEAPVTTAWEVGRGFGDARAFGADVRRHMTSEKVKKSGLSKEIVERYLQVAESGTITGPNGEEIDVRKMIDESGGNSQEAFSESRVAEAESLLESGDLDEEGEQTLEEMLGRPERKSQREREDAKVRIERDR